MLLLILYVLLALGVSFLCSIMEAVLLSVSPSYVAAMEQEGWALGQRLRALKENVDRPLAAILSLNTIAHTVGAAGAGAQAARVYGSAYVGIFSAILTLLILVLSEIIPKTIGATYWRQLAGAVTRILVPTIWIMWPLVKLSQGITRLLARSRDHQSVSRAEFSALAELGHEEGVIEQQESRILQNILRFRDLRVVDIMTPRPVVYALNQEETVGEVVEEYEEMQFSRIPVFSGERENISGYVLKDELLLRVAQDEHDTPLSDIQRTMLVVPESMALPDLFERLLDSGEHIALAVDEYGGFGGIVTMEDLIETLLGTEIVDEADSVSDMQELARRRWLERARRLGLIPETMGDDREAAVKLGITGNPIGGREDTAE